MRIYVCDICGFEYDPARGLPELGIAPGTPFEELPQDFECPICAAAKDHFCGRPVPSAAPAVDDTAVLEQVVVRTPTIKSFRFRPAILSPFKPGQHVHITLPGTGDLSRRLSISNSPTEEGYIEVTKRLTYSPFSKLLGQAEPGFQVSLTYPYGSFVFEGAEQKIALLAGGIGITPLRSICKYIVDKRLTADACLLYSNRSADETAFREDFELMTRSCSRLKVVHTLSKIDSSWTGRTGRIDRTMIREEIPDYAERIFFLCGPPAMVESMQGVLREDLSIPDRQIRAEKFIGY